MCSAPSRIDLRPLLHRVAWSCLLVLAACGDPVGPDPDLAVVTPGDTLFSAVVSGEYHSCALTTDGRAFCWGVLWNHQPGISSIPDDCAAGVVTLPDDPCANTPTPVAQGMRFARLAAGANTTCGITPSGRLFCWGDLSVFPLPSTATPTAIGGKLRFRDVHVRDFICAIGTDNMTYCWGVNSHGSSGIPIGTTQSVDQSLPVAGDHVFANVQSIGEKACGTTAGGALYCWGGIVDAARFEVRSVVLSTCQALRSSGPCTHVPLKLKGPDQWTRRTSSYSPCVITKAGGASCWGLALFRWGGLPFGRGTSVPQLADGELYLPLLLPTPIRDIVGEPIQYGACAHAVDGRVVCWGSALAGQFGSGIEQERADLPTVVVGGRSFSQLSAGQQFMCGLTNARDILCWGEGSRGVLGTGMVPSMNAWRARPSATPTRVASIAGK